MDVYSAMGVESAHQVTARREVGNDPPLVGSQKTSRLTIPHRIVNEVSARFGGRQGAGAGFALSTAVPGFEPDCHYGQ